MNLLVVGPEGGRLSISGAIARTVLKFIPWELSHALIWQISLAPQESSPYITAGFILVWNMVGANAASLMISRKHQTIYDQLAGTYVVLSDLNGNR